MEARTRWTDERLDDRAKTVDGRFDRLERNMDNRFDEVNGRIDSVHRAIFGSTVTVVATILLKGLLGA